MLSSLVIERSLQIERGIASLPSILNALSLGQEGKFVRLINEAKAAVPKQHEGITRIQVYLEVLSVVFYARKGNTAAALERAEAILSRPGSRSDIQAVFDWSSLWTLSLALLSLAPYLPRPSSYQSEYRRDPIHSGEYYRDRLAMFAEQLPMRAAYDFAETALRCFIIALLCHKIEIAQRIVLRQVRAFSGATSGDPVARSGLNATRTAFLLLRQALACFMPVYASRRGARDKTNKSGANQARGSLEKDPSEMRMRVQAQLSEQLVRRALELLSTRADGAEARAVAASEKDGAMLTHRDAIELIWRIMDAQGQLSLFATWLDESSDDPKALYLRRVFTEHMERRRLEADALYAAWQGRQPDASAERLELASKVAEQYLALIEAVPSTDGTGQGAVAAPEDWTLWTRLAELLSMDSGGKWSSEEPKQRQRLEALLQGHCDRQRWLARLAYQNSQSALTVELLLEAFRSLGIHACGHFDLFPWILAWACDGRDLSCASALTEFSRALGESYPGPTDAQMPKWSAPQWRLLLNRVWIDTWSDDVLCSQRVGSGPGSLQGGSQHDLEPLLLLRWSHKCRSLSNQVGTEVSTSNGFLLLAAIRFLRLVPSPACLDVALVILRYGLDRSPHDYILRIACIGLLNALDAPACAMRAWNYLRCKYVQHDSLAYLLGDGVDMILPLYFAFLPNNTGHRYGCESERINASAQIEMQTSLQVENLTECAPALVDAIRSNHLDTGLHLFELFDRIERSARLWDTSVQVDLGRWLNKLSRSAGYAFKSEIRDQTNGSISQSRARKQVCEHVPPSIDQAVSGMQGLCFEYREEGNSPPTGTSPFRVNDLVDNSDWSVIRPLIRPRSGASLDVYCTPAISAMASWCVAAAPHQVPPERIRWTGLWVLLVVGARGRGPDRLLLQQWYKELVSGPYLAENDGDQDQSDDSLNSLADFVHPFDFGYRYDALRREVGRLESAVRWALLDHNLCDADEHAASWRSMLGSTPATLTDRWIFCELRYLLLLALALRMRNRLHGAELLENRNLLPSVVELVQRADWLVQLADRDLLADEHSVESATPGQQEPGADPSRTVVRHDFIRPRLEEIGRALTDPEAIESVWSAYRDEKEQNQVANRALFRLLHLWIQVLVDEAQEPGNQ
ncbi:hypothetical protein F1559_003441 [Cyanidiococcus yangmingshanensis]|uniref:Uncharacterized protein n=1 Tax=Cyanidiococcus yangmingshanensis TaxID=2690220 RepID=A0A7J7ICX4_9RHOD|nr:hypothetical protein F1559_003441 [Cyanidiococcus yangmingshanensis]